MQEQVAAAAQPAGMTFIRQAEVLRKTALSRSTLYELIDAGKFPKPLKIGERINAWPQHEVEEWMQARIAGR